LTDQWSALAHVPILSGVVHLNAQHFELEPLVSTFASRGPPSFRPSSPVDLHTIQRV
jgi:hypothetical protein